MARERRNRSGRVYTAPVQLTIFSYSIGHYWYVKALALGVEDKHDLKGSRRDEPHGNWPMERGSWVVSDCSHIT